MKGLTRMAIWRQRERRLEKNIPVYLHYLQGRLEHLFKQKMECVPKERMTAITSKLCPGKFTSFVYHSCQRNQSYSRGGITYVHQIYLEEIHRQRCLRYLQLRDIFEFQTQSIIFIAVLQLNSSAGVNRSMLQHSRMIAKIHKLPL